jgi:hypothetical protein
MNRSCEIVIVYRPWLFLTKTISININKSKNYTFPNPPRVPFPEVLFPKPPTIPPTAPLTPPRTPPKDSTTLLRRLFTEPRRPLFPLPMAWRSPLRRESRIEFKFLMS